MAFWLLQAPGARTAGATPLDAAPTVTAVSPTSASNDLSTRIIITGADFMATPVVSLGAATLTGVGWVSGAQLQATVPAGLSAGVYTITVTNPDTQFVALANAFTVTSAVAWTTGGPYGGEITELTMDQSTPDKLYTLAQNTGLFGSSDGAANWTVTRFDAWPSHFAVDAASPTHMYLGTYSYLGLVKSDDGGANWSSVPLWDFNGDAPIYPVTHPITPGVVYAGVSAATHRDVVPGELAGVFRSDDYGSTWVTKTVGLTDTQVTVLAFKPGNANDMLAGTRNGNVFSSSDGGQSWSWAAKPADYIGKVYFNPNAPDEVWAVKVGPGLQAGRPNLFRSSWSSLNTWTSVDIMSGGPPYWVTSLAFEPSGALWAGAGNAPTGIYTSSNGVDWSPVVSAPLEVTSIGFDLLNPQIIYAGARCGRFGENLGRTMVVCGVYKSVDHGVTWQPVSQGLAGLAAEALAVSPADLDTVFTYNERGLLKSTSGGSSWQELGIFEHGFPWMGSRLAVDPFTTTRLYLGSSSDYINPGSNTPTVMIGNDDGTGWQNVLLAKPTGKEDWSGDVFAVTVQPAIRGRVLAGATLFPADFDMNRPTRPLGYIYASDDSGLTWRQTSVSQPISGIVQIAYDAVNPNLVWAGTGGPGSSPGTGLLKSTDGGENWSAISSWPVGESCPTVDSIAVHPQRANSVIAACSEGGFVSNNAGVSWDKLPNWWPIQLYSPASPPKLYGGSRWGSNGLFVSTSDGQTWDQIPSLPTNAAVFALAAGSDARQVAMYVAISGGMGGAAASSQQAGVSPMLVSKFSLTERPMGGGVYRQVSRRITISVYLPLVTRQ